MGIPHYNREPEFLRGTVASRESGGDIQEEPGASFGAKKEGRDHTHRTPPMKTYQPDARVHRKNTQWPEVERFEKENVILGYDPNYKTDVHNPYWKQQQQQKTKALSESMIWGIDKLLGRTNCWAGAS